MQVWSPRDTYVNHHEVTNLLVDLPEDGPMRDSIFAIMRVSLPPGCLLRPLRAPLRSTLNISHGGFHVPLRYTGDVADILQVMAIAVVLTVQGLDLARALG